jgi:hypothetical protein
VSFTAVAAIGLKVAKALMLGANTIEGIQGNAKGDGKRELALRFAQEALGFCQDNQGVPYTDKVREAMKKYNDAYVELQNALAEATGGK